MSAADPPRHTDIEAAMRALLAERAPPKTICPSEVARRLAGDAPTWRALMPLVREVAVALARAGELEITQGGEVVDGARARGAIRLRRVR